jgi:hypothetical protein
VDEAKSRSTVAQAGIDARQVIRPDMAEGNNDVGGIGGQHSRPGEHDEFGRVEFTIQIAGSDVLAQEVREFSEALP